MSTPVASFEANLITQLSPVMGDLEAPVLKIFTDSFLKSIKSAPKTKAKAKAKVTKKSDDAAASASDSEVKEKKLSAYNLFTQEVSKQRKEGKYPNKVKEYMLMSMAGKLWKEGHKATWEAALKGGQSFPTLVIPPYSGDVIIAVGSA